MTWGPRPHATVEAPAGVPGAMQWLWVLDELRFVWREAQMEAATAYLHWRRMRDRTAYAVYRAAQDRADAAQDALTNGFAAAPR